MTTPPSSDVLAAFSLDRGRHDIATRGDANVVVLAGPGAGKTHLLVAHAVWLASQQRGRVIMLTYSRKAAGEMKRRADSALSIENRPLVVASTIHAHALDLLRNHGHRVGLQGEVEPIESKDVQLIADELARREGLTLQEDFASRFERYQRVRGDLRAQGVPPLVGLVDAEMRRTGRLDWDSCIRLATELLAHNVDVRESVRHHDRNVLLDEAQDCDAGQLALLEQLVGPPPGDRHLFVVMDPDQSLYRFRQADPELVRAWASSYVTEEVEVTENFRCAPRVQAVAKRVLDKPWSGPLTPGIASLRGFADRGSEAEWIRGEVMARVAMGSDAKRIAILARRRSLLTEVEASLSSRIAIRRDPREQWSPPEERILAAIAFIKDWRDGVGDPRVVATFFRAVVGQTSEQAMLNEQNSLRAQRHPGDLFTAEWWRDLTEWLEQRRSTVQIVDRLLPIANAKEDDIRGLRALAQQSRSLTDLLKTATGGPNLANMTQGAGVLVTTFHGAKGLEFDTVFVVGCEDGTIPDFRARGEKELRDERRGMYVAITRAATEILLTYVTQERGFKKQPSRFLPRADEALWSP